MVELERVALQKRPQRRLALLIDGVLEIHRHKTAMALLRYCPEDVVCVIEPGHAGADLFALVGVGAGIPVLGSVADALPLRPDYLVIGVATGTGEMPQELRAVVYEAIRARIGIISGLHSGLTTDPNIASQAARHAVDLIDLRQLDQEFSHIATGAARNRGVCRVMTVGTDCNIGMMTTALQLELHFRRQEIRARFVATGQNGILIKGRGTRIDRVIADFAAGATEELVLREAEGMDLLLLHGQGALLSPAFSGVCLSMLHGALPDAMILVHRPGRDALRHSAIPMPPLVEHLALYERIMQPLHPPAKVVAVALNTMGMSENEAALALQEARQNTGLPAADVVRHGEAGCAILAEAILGHARQCGYRIEAQPGWYTSYFDAARPIGLKD